MLEYLARKSFKSIIPQGEKLIHEGETLLLSSLKASTGVQRGYLLEKNVSGLQDILRTCEARAQVLIEKLQCPVDQANERSNRLAVSLLIRHASLKSYRPPTTEFLEEVEAFNRKVNTKNPILKEQSDKGVGEWAGYTCNIGTGCSHGCLYCYAEKMAIRFNRVENHEAWMEEVLREVSTEGCKRYESPIMCPTTHDITPSYLSVYRCHLYNLLDAGNIVLIVTKPHRKSIEAICSEFTSFRDNMIFRFTIGGLDDDAIKIWEPGAPSLSERMESLQYAFEQGFKTSISSEPMLVSCEEAERFYYMVEPLVTEDIWFGKMSNVGGFRKNTDPEVAKSATALHEIYRDDNILQFVRRMSDLPKVQWKDSIKEIIAKQAG